MINNNSKEYKSKGFIVLKNVIPKNIINNAFKYLVKRTDIELNMILPGLNSKNFNKKKKILSKIKMTKKQKNILHGQFSLETRLSDKILKIATRPLMINKINKILNKKIRRIHMPIMSRFLIPKNTYALTFPHQDISYNKHMSDFCTVWIPMVKINKKTGGIRFYKNKKNKVLQTKKIKKKFWLKLKKNSLIKDKDVNEMNVGDILIFDKFAIHSSLPNHSKKIRYSIDVRYMCSKEKTKKSFYDLETKKNHVIK